MKLILLSTIMFIISGCGSIDMNTVQKGAELPVYRGAYNSVEYPAQPAKLKKFKGLKGRIERTRVSPATVILMGGVAVTPDETVNFDYSGEGFFWSNKEKCYNAFFTASANKEVLQKERDSAQQKFDEQLAQRRAMGVAPKEEDLTAEQSKEIEGLRKNLNLAVESYFAPNENRIQLCPTKANKYKVNIVLNGHPVFITPNEIRDHTENEYLKLFIDKQNKTARIEWKGKATIPYGAPLKEDYKSDKVTWRPVHNSTGKIMSPLYKADRDPASSFSKKPGKNWGSWRKAYELTWRSFVQEDDEITYTDIVTAY